jgi:hypothetical protein
MTNHQGFRFAYAVSVVQPGDPDGAPFGGSFVREQAFLCGLRITSVVAALNSDMKAATTIN